MSHFTASIVTAVYNIDLFLREAIESVISQDIGFENIQLILVDDGSTDTSGQICDEYAAKYPNIVVIHKANGGVSSARNEGLKHIQGKYVNFMDGDDMLVSDAVRKACTFLDTHIDKTDVVALPVYFFDQKNDGHVLNYKHNRGPRLIDLSKEYQNIHLQISSTFVTRKCLEGKQFDPRLAYAEDAKLLIQILLDKQTIGVASDTKYMYRYRSSGQASAIQSSLLRPARYLPYMHHFQHSIIQHCQTEYAQIPNFVQYTLMYDLQWRLTQNTIPDHVLTHEDQTEYKLLIQRALQCIDDHIIVEQQNMGIEFIHHAFTLKYGGIPAPTPSQNNISFKFSSVFAYKASDFLICPESLSTRDGNLTIRSTLYTVPISQPFSVNCLINGVSYPCTLSAPFPVAVALDEPVYYSYTVTSTFKLREDSTNEIQFSLHMSDLDILLHKISYSHRFPIVQDMEHAYAKLGNWIIRNGPQGFSIQHSNSIDIDLKQLEWHFCNELCIKKRLSGIKAVMIRSLVKTLCAIKRRPLWLISVASEEIDADIESLSHFLKNSYTKINHITICEKNHPSYAALKKTGRVAANGSHFHKILYLTSDLIIFDKSKTPAYCPFLEDNYYFRDIINTKSVFDLCNQRV